MKIIRNVLVATALSSFIGVGNIAHAAGPWQQSSHRQKTKNDWRNLSYLTGAASLYGLLKGDKTLFFVGAVGALYSASRYEADRKSQSQSNRARAALFSRSSFRRDGVLYVRHTKWKNGKKYYYFAKHK